MRANFLIAITCSWLLVFSLSAKAENELYNQLQVTNLEGETVDLNRYKGRIVLLNFWATWCPPCIKEMPSMNRLQQQFDTAQFQVIAVNMGQPATTVESFLMEVDFAFDLPIYLDEPGRSFTDLKIQGMPSSFLIATDGTLMETIIGAREWDHPDNIKALKALITEQKKGA